ncbi:MAG TPA: PASTA domain-containing protein [Thermoanaerobaculia bacterium]|nr:PASTA domain-containing protein [Thermoanaerobaculia bacterium]
MKRGCLNQLVFLLLLGIAFGGSSYFWFKFFVRGKSVQTPNLVGRDLSDARAFASDLGLILIVDNNRDRNAEDVPVGAVVWQNRSAGSLIKRGTRLHVGQSLGPLVLRVPDLTGQSPRTALLRFSQRNLKLGHLAYIDHLGTEGIIAEDPPKETVVEGQTPVSLLVAFAAPPPSWVMPDLIDRALDSVRPALQAHGLNVTNVRFESYPGIRDGIIIRQYPPVGAPVSAREPITLVVSRGEQVGFGELQ